MRIDPLLISFIFSDLISTFFVFTFLLFPFLSLRYPLSSCYWFSKIHLEELLKVVPRRWRLLTSSSTRTAFKNPCKFNNFKTWRCGTLINPFLLLHHLLVYYRILLCRVLVIRILVGLNFSIFFLALRKDPVFDHFRYLEFCKFYIVDFITPMCVTSVQAVVKSPSAVHRLTSTKPTTRSRFKQPINFVKKSAQGLLKGKGKVIPLQARCGPEGG